jgi:DNA polymerase III gamma/tau subunit
MIFYGGAGSGKSKVAELFVKECVYAKKTRIVKIVDGLRGVNDFDQNRFCHDVDKGIVYGKSYIFITDDLENAIPKLKSRCKLVPFYRVSNDQLMKLIGKVVAGEGIPMEPHIGMMIAKKSSGDFRQLYFELERLTTKKGKITVEDVDIKKLSLDVAVKATLDGNYPKAHAEIRKLIADGMKYNEFEHEIFEYIIREEIEPKLKIEMLSVFNRIQGKNCNDKIRVYNLVAEIIKILKGW